MAIVSDLHLEKGSHYARRGFFLPPHDTHETLERLHASLADLNARNILVLGDTFHDDHGYNRLSLQDRALFETLIEFNPIWIIGNHDGNFVPSGFTAHKSFLLDGIIFNHEAQPETSFEISGHYHPKIEIIHKKGRVSRRCFVEDGVRIILPAFGAYTGGLSITDKSFTQIINNPRIYALGEKIYALKI